MTQLWQQKKDSRIASWPGVTTNIIIIYMIVSRFLWIINKSESYTYIMIILILYNLIIILFTYIIYLTIIGLHKDMVPVIIAVEVDKFNVVVVPKYFELKLDFNISI